VVAVLALVGLHRLGDLLPHLANPFGTETVDRTGPVVLKALDDLHEYQAATGSFQVLVDIEQDARYLPSFIKGQRTLFVATGSVDAGVDFSGLDPAAVTVDAGRHAVTLRLPHARLSAPHLDPAASYVASRDRGLLDRIGGVFSDTPTGERSLQLAAEPRLAAAAEQAGLAARAEENTRSMLEKLLGALGFTRVEVDFAPPPTG
jgi:hypothetical protein